MDILQLTRDEIIAEFQQRLEADYPDYNIIKGSPLYDLIINRLADVVKTERDIVNVITDVARVVPMFDDSGNLRSEYEGMEDYIVERFFLENDSESEVWNTVYLKFNKKARISIRSGSFIIYGTTQLDVRQTILTLNSPLWIQSGNTYMHPVDIKSSDVDESEFIPETDAWVTGGIRYESNTPVVLLVGAESRRAINTVERPKTTLSGVRNSISNRSFSNIRSLKYNFRNNSIFNPDNLIRSKVMHVTDPAFIERRKILWEDDDTALSCVTSGDGKTLLDYGNQLNIADVTFEYIERDDPLYSEIEEPLVIDNTEQMLRSIKVSGVTTANSDKGYLYGFLSYSYDNTTGEVTVTLTFYKHPYVDGDTPDPAQAVLSGSAVSYTTGVADYPSIRIILDAVNYSGLTGWCDIVIDPQYYDVNERDAFFRIQMDTFSLYKISTRNLGLLSPVAIGSTTDMTTLKERLESVDIADIITPFTKASSSIPNSVLLVRGDVLGQISDVSYVPADLDTASLSWGSVLDGNLYWRILVTAGGSKKYFVVSTDPTFKDPSLFLTRTEIPLAYTAGTPLILDMPSNVFMQMSVTFTADFAGLVEHVLSDSYLAPPYSFVRNANDYLIIRSVPNMIAANNYDGQTASILYYGTNVEDLQQSQEALINVKAMEAGHRILVSPMRPVVLTAYYTEEYVSPFMTDKDYSSFPNGDELNERLDTIKSKYVDLITYLEEYFSSYSGYISDIDFSQIAGDAYAATGMHIKKLDFVVFTQRGYKIRGYLKMSEESRTYITWSDITDDVREQVDDIYEYFTTYLPEVEREENVTDETLYKPVFSKVGL